MSVSASGTVVGMQFFFSAVFSPLWSEAGSLASRRRFSEFMYIDESGIASLALFVGTRLAAVYSGPRAPRARSLRVLGEHQAWSESKRFKKDSLCDDERG